MKHESRQHGLVGLVAPLLVAILLATPALAQQSSAKKPDDKPATTSKVRKKPRGRLPSYFSKVVTEKQRLEIYDIQAKYQMEVEKLQKQLADLLAKRSSEVDKVLTAEQRAEVEQMRAKRKSRAQSSSKPAPDGPGKS